MKSMVFFLGFVYMTACAGAAVPSVIDGFNPEVNATVRALAVQDDSKILVGGDFTQVGGTACSRIARIAHEGSLDTTFTTKAKANDSVFAIALQPDAKILIGGKFTTVNGAAHKYIARINADGSVDSTFACSAGYYVNALAVQGDGKILVAGSFVDIGGASRSRIARLNANGSADTSFNPGSGANGTINALALHPDGKVFIGGDFTTFNGTSRVRVARLKANGSLDTTFNPGSGVNAAIYALGLQVDGKILLGGEFTVARSAPHPYIARLTSTGWLDSAYTASTDQRVNAMLVQPDGKVVIGGLFTKVNNTARARIARLDFNGKLDEAFAPLGANGGNVNALALESDGGVVAGGSFAGMCGAVRTRLARIEPGGGLDNTFNTGTGRGNHVSFLTLQSDGKTVLAGDWTTTDGTTRCNMWRVNADGSPDKSFRVGRGAITALAAQADDKLIIGGSFSDANATSRAGIIRLDENGLVDAGFHPPEAVASFTVRGLAMQPDGKILAGGAGSQAGKPMNVMRLNTDGSLDTTYTTNAAAVCNLTVNKISLCADGRLYVSTYGNYLYQQIKRLKADGTLDIAFTPADYPIYDILAQPDGKLIMRRYFYLGTDCGNIVRLTADGWPDMTFVSDLSTSSTIRYDVTKMALTPEGKLLVAGSFNPVSGGGRKSLVRLNANGKIDATFNQCETKEWAYTNDFAVRPNGKIVFGGNWTEVNGKTARNLAQLNADGTLDASFKTYGVGIYDAASDVVVQPDGRVILAMMGPEDNHIIGTMRFYSDGNVDHLLSNTYERPVAIYADGSIQLTLSRHKPDGSMDPTYRPPRDGMQAAAVQPDNKVIFYGGNRFLRMNTDGTWDTEFKTGEIRAGHPVLLSDGKILVSTGDFNGVYRLYGWGAIDRSFYASILLGNERVIAMAEQPDHKILIGGNFTQVNGKPHVVIARVTSDGILDTSFTPAIADGVIHTITLQSDGKIIIAGDFITTGPAVRNLIARLNDDGTVDKTFDAGVAYSDIRIVSYVIQDIALQADGKILIAQDFRQSGIIREGAGRLTNPTPARQKLSISADGHTVTWELGGSFPWPYVVLFEQSNDGINWGLLGLGVAVPGVGYRLSGLSSSVLINGYIRASGFVQQGNARTTTSLFRSVLRTFDPHNAAREWTHFE